MMQSAPKARMAYALGRRGCVPATNLPKPPYLLSLKPQGPTSSRLDPVGQLSRESAHTDLLINRLF